MSAFLLAGGCAFGVVAIGFLIRCAFTDPREPHWSGWAAMVSAAVATFLLILRGQP